MFRQVAGGPLAPRRHCTVVNSGSSDGEEETETRGDSVLVEGLNKLRKKGALTVAVRRQICAGLNLDDHIGQIVFQMIGKPFASETGVSIMGAW